MNEAVFTDAAKPVSFEKLQLAGGFTGATGEVPRLVGCARPDLGLSKILERDEDELAVFGVDGESWLKVPSLAPMLSHEVRGSVTAGVGDGRGGGGGEY